MMLRYLYVIANETDNKCKIGISDTPKKRVSQLQTGNPESLSLQFCIKSDANFIETLERLIHVSLDSKRLMGEWFLITAENATTRISSFANFMHDYRKKHGHCPKSYEDLIGHQFGDNNNYTFSPLKGFRGLEKSS